MRTIVSDQEYVTIPKTMWSYEEYDKAVVQKKKDYKKNIQQKRTVSFRIKRRETVNLAKKKKKLRFDRDQSDDKHLHLQVSKFLTFAVWSADGGRFDAILRAATW
uniref:Uncharacterized protein n=1 Tax=Megaselia scalaris TaxID=36166 RepID=T1GXM0_MEGSC